MWIASWCWRVEAPATIPKAPQSSRKPPAAAGDDRDIIVLDLPPWSALEVNPLQCASAIVVQKSPREGFGLTVTEGLWKRKPTIASAVGGVPHQIIDQLTGVLAR
jgi:trehalose synthase